jgi:hypothetical protein
MATWESNGGEGVAVGATVAVEVGATVGVAVGTEVGVAVGATVAVGVGVGAAVGVAVAVEMGVMVEVGSGGSGDFWGGQPTASNPAASTPVAWRNLRREMALGPGCGCFLLSEQSFIANLLSRNGLFLGAG